MKFRLNIGGYVAGQPTVKQVFLHELKKSDQLDLTVPKWDPPEIEDKVWKFHPVYQVWVSLPPNSPGIGESPLLPENYELSRVDRITVCKDEDVVYGPGDTIDTQINLEARFGSDKFTRIPEAEPDTVDSLQTRIRRDQEALEKLKAKAVKSATVTAAKTGFNTTNEQQPGYKPGAYDMAKLEKMNAAELRKFADEEEVEIEGLTSKSEILKVFANLNQPAAGVK